MGVNTKEILFCIYTHPVIQIYNMTIKSLSEVHEKVTYRSFSKRVYVPKVSNGAFGWRGGGGGLPLQNT
mgnify:CR=1 FL=1